MIVIRAPGIIYRSPNDNGTHCARYQDVRGGESRTHTNAALYIFCIKNTPHIYRKDDSVKCVFADDAGLRSVAIWNSNRTPRDTFAACMRQRAFSNFKFAIRRRRHAYIGVRGLNIFWNRPAVYECVYEASGTFRKNIYISAPAGERRRATCDRPPKCACSDSSYRLRFDRKFFFLVRSNVSRSRYFILHEFVRRRREFLNGCILELNII